MFVIGCPRGGSTLTFNLLAQNPQTRCPMAWEMGNAALSITPPATGPNDGRGKAASERMSRIRLMLPEWLAQVGGSHLVDAEIPEECYNLWGHQFFKLTSGVGFESREYMNWLLDDANKDVMCA